jgi:hypothetical protein
MNPFEGAGQLWDRYKPDVSVPKDWKNEWISRQNEISQEAGDNPLKHLQLPFGLHYPLYAGLGYGAYKLMRNRQNALNNRTFERNMQYVGGMDTDALDAYKRIKNTPAGLGRTEWAQQLVGRGDISQNTLDRLNMIGDEANDIISVQNRMANPTTGSIYRNFYKQLGDDELSMLDRLRGKNRSITAEQVANQIGEMRRSGAAAKEIAAADSILARMNRAKAAGVSPPVLFGALEDMGGVSGLNQVKGLERAGMINVGKQGLFTRLLGGLTGRGRLR